MRRKWDVPNEDPAKGRRIRSDVDRGWAWVVLGAAVFNTVITAGQILSANIYFVIFLQEFRASRSYTAWIPAATSTTLCMSGPLSSQLIQRLGPRRMIFLSSFMLTACFVMLHFATSLPYVILVFALIGTGHTFAICGNLAAISTYFKTKAPLATGITMAGTGIGSMVVGLEIEWAVETYGWKGAALIQAGLTLNLCVGAALMYALRGASPAEELGGGDDSVAVPVRLLVADVSFWLSVLAFLTVNANLATMNAILKELVLSYGLESTFKTVIVTVGLGSIVSRLLAGPISACVCPPIHLFAASVACTLSIASLAFARIPWAMAVASFAFAFSQGQLVVVWLLQIAWVFGQKKMPVVRGYIMFFGLVTSMSCPPLAGYTVDLTGNYNIALTMVASFSLMTSVCALVIFYKHRQKPREGEASHPTTSEGAAVAECVHSATDGGAAAPTEKPIDVDERSRM